MASMVSLTSKLLYQGCKVGMSPVSLRGLDHGAWDGCWSMRKNAPQGVARTDMKIIEVANGLFMAWDDLCMSLCKVQVGYGLEALREVRHMKCKI